MARRRRAKHRRTSKTVCIVKSGRQHGKLKKGWRFGKSGNCVRARRGC